MSSENKKIVTEDLWAELRGITPARIGLGRCGSSLPHKASLNFKLDHARARDAVYKTFRTDELMDGLNALGVPSLLLQSRVADRREFLVRPDRGRMLSPDSLRVLQQNPGAFDISFAISDGLSPGAIHENAVDFLSHHLKILTDTGLSLSPVCIIQNGRVAAADEIGKYFSAQITVMLIGERPGLSSPNSMGIYMTYMARPGCTDESRNCISNIRQGGLTIPGASIKLAYLIENALKMKKSGVHLKDRMDSSYLPFGKDVRELME
jgi:ethanolamine ammonia-lyase small subunit